MKELRILEREMISTGFLKVERLKIELPDGKTMYREVLQKKNVVAIVAINSEGEIYLTMQPRAGVNDLQSIEIPAGLVEEGEDFQEASKRELLEETGCVTKSPLIQLGAPFTGDPACCTSITHLYLAINVEKVQEPELDADEFLVPMKENVGTILSWIEEGKIRDANSVIAIGRAARFLGQR